MEDLTKLFEPIRQQTYKGTPRVGVHVNWNVPKGKAQPAWEILLGILSACYWNAFNGPIDLYTDEIGLQKVQNLGLKGLYRNVHLLDPEMWKNFNPETFWAAGKFMAMLECNEPAYIIDQDLVITKSLAEFNSNVVYFHREKLTPDWYPHDILKTVNEMYQNQTMEVAFNCALVHFQDVQIMRKYASDSLRFINNFGSDFRKFPANAVMCSIEQFGLHQFCKLHELSSTPMIKAVYTPNIIADFWEADGDGINDIEYVADWAYHSWAEKGHLRSDFQASIDFSMQIVTILERKLGISMDPLIKRLNFKEHQ